MNDSDSTLSPDSNKASTARPAVITVSVAQAEYRKLGENAIHQGYRDVIKSLVRSGYSDPIKNDSYADALFLTDIMFEHTDNSVRMLTGGGADGFISTLHKTFEDMLTRVKENNGFVRVICISDKAPACLTELTKKFPKTLSFALAKSAQRLNHFIVCDDHMVRMEQVHDDLTPETPACDIKAEVLFNSAPRAKFSEGFFDTIWAKVKKNSVEK